MHNQKIPGQGAATIGAALLLATTLAQGAEITLSVDLANSADAVYVAFNPRGVNGLLPVASAGYELTGTRTIVGCKQNYDPGSITTGVSATAAAAGYGSDSSIDGRYNPGLLGTSVEPMADVQVHASLSRTSTCVGSLGLVEFPVSASVGGSVNHRVVARPSAGGLGSLLDSLIDIPVRLDYALATSRDGKATAFAGFYVELEGQRLFEAVARPDINPEVSGTWSTFATRTTGQQEFLYNIRVFAGADATPGFTTDNGEDSASAQAVADPFLYIDPDWEYAQYFMVQQESVANPGGWAEVTREWRSTVVPVPGALWLGLSACGALLPWVRRRSPTSARPASAA